MGEPLTFVHRFTNRLAAWLETYNSRSLQTGIASVLSTGTAEVQGTQRGEQLSQLGKETLSEILGTEIPTKS